MTAVWTFAIALDMSTHLSVAYLDIRVRLYFNGQRHNSHLIATPIHDRHTAEVIFDASAAVLEALEGCDDRYYLQRGCCSFSVEEDTDSASL